MCIDLHVHTKRCHHAEMDLEDYIIEAISKNIEILGFAEHAPLPYNLNRRLSTEEAISYVEDIEKLKNKYQNQIKILCGFEIDYMEQYDKEIRLFIENIKADYFLGSIHFLLFEDKIYQIWDYNDIYNNKKLQKEYFRLMTKAIKSNYFHSISHPDLILRTGIDQSELINNFKEIFVLLVDNDVGYEINGSGISKTKYSNDAKMMVRGGYLSKEILTYASKFGVWFTIGSDAHKIIDLGQGLNEILEFAAQNRLRIYYFDKGNKINYELINY